MLKSFGLNSSGQLGLGSSPRRDDPSRPISFACGDYDSSLISKDIDRIMTSDNNHIAIEEVKDVQCTNTFTCVLLYNGTIYVTGTLSNVVYTTLTKIEYMFPIKATSIAVGKRHIIALLEGGFVMSWGVGYYGQLGHNDLASWDSPKLIHFLDPQNIGCKVAQVCCGGSHSGCVTDNGGVFMWGSNKMEQCGLGQAGRAFADACVLRPHPIDLSAMGNQKASQLVLGRNHSAILTAEGRVFVCGACSFGRLGLSNVRKNVEVFQEISSLKGLNIQWLASGDHHMLALGKGGAVYSWGFNAEGEGGHQLLMHLKSPKKIDYFDGVDVVSISCGNKYCFATTKTGLLYAWGYGDGGWLGIHPRDVSSSSNNNTKNNGELVRVDSDDALNNFVDYPIVKAFDSSINILTPKRVTSVQDYFVTKVSCGGSHTILFISGKNNNAAAGTSSRRIVNNRVSSNSEDMDVADEKSYADDSSGGKTGYNGYKLSGDFGGANLSAKRTSSNDDDVEAAIRYEKITIALADFKPFELNSQLLSWARHKKFYEMSYALDKKLVDINTRDDAENTPLIIACQNGNFEIVRLLIQHNASVGCVNIKGNTALHFSLAYGYKDIGEYLIANGADEYAVNKDNLTPYEGLSSKDLDNF